MVSRELSFRSCLTSSAAFGTVGRAASSSAGRASVVIFGGPRVLGRSRGPCSSVMVIRFGEPVQSSCASGRGPVSRMGGCTHRLLRGGTLSGGKQPFSLHRKAPLCTCVIYSLAVGVERFTRSRGFAILPSGSKCFGFGGGCGLCVRVVDFSGLVGSSGGEGGVLFRGLGLPATWPTGTRTRAFTDHSGPARGPGLTGRYTFYRHSASHRRGQREGKTTSGGMLTW